MEIDKDRVDEMVLALLYLTTFKDKPNWGNNLLDAQSRDCQNCSMRPFRGQLATNRTGRRSPQNPRRNMEQLYR